MRDYENKEDIFESDFSISPNLHGTNRLGDHRLQL